MKYQNTENIETREWRFQPEINRVTAIDPGNCRVRVAEGIFGINDREWMANGKLIAMAPRLADLAHLVLATATIETNQQLIDEAAEIINILRMEGQID